MKKISDIFTIKTGGDLWLEKEIPGDIPVISLGFENNGVVGYIQKNDDHRLYPAGSITVSGWAGGMKAFVQIKDFYVRGRVKVLIPKQDLSLQQKFYYCCCFNANAYRYTYGRKSSSNRFSDILIPSISEIPSWIGNISVPSIKTKVKKKKNIINVNSWNNIALKEIFNAERGTRLTKKDQISGDIPFVTAGYLNQGVTSTIGNSSMKKYKNCLTIDMFGNCFYREYDFCCDDNILVLQCKNGKVNKRVLLFIATIINKDKYRYSYGKQYRKKDFDNHIIKLPYINGNLDLNYINNYMDSIPYIDKV